jgi:hypothetical protein
MIVEEHSQIGQLKKKINYNSYLLETLHNGTYQQGLYKSLKKWEAMIEMELNKRHRLLERLDELTDFNRVKKKIELLGESISQLDVTADLLRGKLGALKAELGKHESVLSKRAAQRYQEGSIIAGLRPLHKAPSVLQSLHVAPTRQPELEFEEEVPFLVAD